MPVPVRDNPTVVRLVPHRKPQTLTGNREGRYWFTSATNTVIKKVERTEKGVRDRVLPSFGCRDRSTEMTGGEYPSDPV